MRTELEGIHLNMYLMVRKSTPLCEWKEMRMNEGKFSLCLPNIVKPGLSASYCKPLLYCAYAVPEAELMFCRWEYIRICINF